MANDREIDDSPNSFLFAAVWIFDFGSFEFVWDLEFRIGDLILFWGV
jgi:hypothetical protein